MNPHLTKADWKTEDSEWKECDQMGKFVSGGPRDAHTGCSNSPGFGSGMTWDPCNEKIYTITDRGPNQNCGDIDDDYKAGKVPNRSPGVSSGKGFPLEKFSPAMTEIAIDGEKISIVNVSPFHYNEKRNVTSEGTKYEYKWATGRGTKSDFVKYDDDNKMGADDKSSTGDCKAVIPCYDQGGLDTEDVQPLGTYKGMELFIACDEYGKVIVFDKAGKILVTYVPKGQTTVITEAKTGSPVSMRRKNRGLESIAVSGDKTRAYTCMQSTMDAAGASSKVRKELGNGTDIRQSRVIRCAILDITDPLAARTLQEKYFFASPINEYPPANKAQKDIKVSAAYWLAENKVMVLERAKGLVRFHEVDFDTGGDLSTKTIYVTLDSKFAAIRNLEGKTVCGKATCSDACCPAGTCDTAPKCTENSATGEKKMDGKNAPLAMKSTMVFEMAGEADGGKAMSGRSLETWEDRKEVDNVFGRGKGGEFGAGMLWKLEGFFLINEYHMAVINDNDFGLEGNTHVQVAVVQTKTKMTLDKCQIKPTCKAGVPDKCSVSSANTLSAAFSSQLMASTLIVLLASAVAHYMH